MRKVVGIDLGTTFSAIAHVNEFGRPEVIPNAEGERITPSVILFDDDVTIIGETAWRHAIVEPEKIAQLVKLQMGKSKDEFSMEFGGVEYSAEELSALILKKLKQDAEAYLGTEITDAVITVPAYFKDAERQATRNAGKIAGLNVLQMMSEPTAAALAYGIRYHDADQAGQTVFVFDLGGGTFDVTVMKVSGSELEMVATNGDHSLGGKDWDERIITYLADFFEIEHGENPLDDLHTNQDFQLWAVDAKQILSAKQKTRIVCGHNGKNTSVELTQEKFAELTADLLERCGTLCDVVLSEASMTWTDINTVLLAGGSTRMPMVREMIAKVSGKEINPQEVNPDEVVALGAAIQGVFLINQPDYDSDAAMSKHFSEWRNSRRDAFIAVIYTLKSVLGTLTDDQLKRLLQKADRDYGLTRKEATQILNASGLIVGKPVNYFQVLGLRIEDIQNQSEETIKTLVDDAQFRLYRKAMDDHTDRGVERRKLLNTAKSTLLNPQKRREHLAVLKTQIH